MPCVQPQSNVLVYSSQSVPIQEVQHDLVPSRGIDVERRAVAGLGLDVRLQGFRARIQGPLDRLVEGAGAVARAEQVVFAEEVLK